MGGCLSLNDSDAEQVALTDEGDSGAFTTFSVWSGKDNSEVTFDDALIGAEFYRYRNSDCDISNYSSCDNGQLDILDGNTIIDTTFNQDNTAYYQLKYSADISQNITSKLTPSVAGGDNNKVLMHNLLRTEHYQHQMLNFKNQLWIIGGYSGSEYQNNVWTSNDGQNWSLKVKNAGFTPRRYHQALVYNNKLWVIGGEQAPATAAMDPVVLNDVWSSEDGLHWTQESANADFPVRYRHQSVVFDNKIWVIGGYQNKGQIIGDIWSSSNGTDWQQQISSSAIFSPRMSHRVTVLGNKLFLVGGASTDYYRDGSVMGDIWTSSNGIDWSEVTDSADFPARIDHQLITHQDKLWLIAGHGGSAGDLDDVWTSINGSQWQQIDVNTGFGKRMRHQVTALNGKLWLHEGRTSWSSTDGVDWEKHQLPNPPHARTGHQNVVFNNKIWMISGASVWSSQNGINWTEEVADAGFPSRNGHESFVFNNKLWVIGGGGKTDAWSSEDGVNWVEVTDNLPSLFGFAAAVHDNKIWIIGGVELGTGFASKDVWSSTDGATWTLETSTAGFWERTGHSLTSFNNKLWLTAGDDYEGEVFNDVWSSSNGIDWVLEANRVPLNRTLAYQVSYNGKLWLIGGILNGKGRNDVWSSNDGKNWTQETAEAAFPKTYDHQVVVQQNKLMLIGGKDNYDVWSSIDGIEWRQGRNGVIKIN